MGAWSHKPFGNDHALDWVGDLTDLPQASWRAQILAVFEAFDAYEARRARGENKEIMTIDEARRIIGLFEVPNDEYSEILLAAVGQEFEDLGEAETLTLIAASHVLLSALADDRSGLPDELLEARFDSLSPLAPLARQAAALLAIVPTNRPLCREYGPTWKRGVAALTQRLLEVADAQNA